MKKYMLSVDPGVTTLGLALWELDKVQGGKCHCPKVAGVTIHGGGTDTTPHILEVVRQAIDIVEERWKASSSGRIRLLVSEYPELFGGNVVSQASASEGYVQDMALIVGMLAGYYNCVRDGRFVKYTVGQWKGNAPKEVTHHHVCDVMMKHSCLADLQDALEELKRADRGHALDAVGVGLHHMGLY